MSNRNIHWLKTATPRGRHTSRQKVERVDLALEETLSANCKLEGVCYIDYDNSENTYEAGS